MIRNFELGRVYYLTLSLHFPDKEVWTRQQPFTKSLEKLLKNINYPPKICGDLLRKGESSYKDDNGIWWVFKVEDKKRTENWGKH